MKYAFYPGCVAQGAAPELYNSTIEVCRMLGIELDAAADAKRVLHGRGRAAREEPASWRHAERAQLRARRKVRLAPADDLQHMPGRDVAGEQPPHIGRRLSLFDKRRPRRRGLGVQGNGRPQALALDYRRGHRSSTSSSPWSCARSPASRQRRSTAATSCAQVPRLVSRRTRNAPTRWSR